MKNPKRSFVIVLILVAGIASGLWFVVPGWLPFVIRDHRYRQLIGDFQRARPMEEKAPETEGRGWDFQIQVPEGQTTARVHASEHNSVVKVTFADEDRERELYRYVDYTHPKEIRTDKSILYVRWVEILVPLRTTDWILTYDLSSRREIMRRRIDVEDLKKGDLKQGAGIRE